ncbi:MAG TPA: PIN domain-containing protein [Solirubrobacterales bacterium]|nr:PIN domain-containing protein [Solirubrobacterales bacterium]
MGQGAAARRPEAGGLNLLLDTTVLIDALRGREAADRIRVLGRESSLPYACAINVEEVWRGARADEGEAIDRLLSGLRIAPLGEREGKLAGSWRREFAARGVTLSQSDCLVAAAAVSVGAVVATGDLTGFPMPGVEVEHWPTGG